jgi:hypothetical protein
MSTIHRVRPSIGLKKDSVPKLVSGAKVIQGKFVENSSILANPPVTPAVFLTQITDVDVANQAVKTSKGAGPARKVKVDLLWATLGTLCQFVQQLCDQSPEKASSFIAASGFKETAVGARVKVVLDAQATTEPGQVALKVTSSLLQTPKNRPSAARTFLFRHTLDGKTFVTDEPSSVAHTVVGGLPSVTQVGFQVAAKDASGVSAWSVTVYCVTR